MFINPNLTNDEKNVLFNKATERPFSGIYDKHFENGVYVCKNCSSLLYHSQDKFDAGCGWPAFDDQEIEAVTKIPDIDGIRTEIVCSNCQAHLGHIFVSENLTPKNQRHCVNSLSISFVSREKLQRVVLGAGCFWGVEHLFKKLDGVISAVSGYSGGEIENPSYELVCTGKSGHYEVVEIWFNNQKISLEEILKYFFEIHDFQQANGQGPDIGEQYKSVIFYENQQTKEIAKKLIQELTNKGYSTATMLIEAKDFYRAESYHQKYYQKTGKQPYCHIHKKIF